MNLYRLDNKNTYGSRLSWWKEKKCFTESENNEVYKEESTIVFFEGGAKENI